MAVGPIGNAIFVNQQTATVASLQGNQNNRFDLQNVMAQAAANEKDEKVMEVRPTEENYEVDEDREHQKNEADQENKRNPKHKEQEEEEQESSPLHILDIKV
ncbi:MAG: hypothetical protein RBR54_05060 [Sulfurimonas sp.]|nr:hypothetical protein [Sulfurimonas sp.]